MSIPEHANLAECLDGAILGCIFQLQSSTKKWKIKVANDLVRHASGLSATNRHPTCWFFSNKSIKFLLVQTVPLGMYTTTLPREGIRRGKTFRNFKFAEFASRTPPGGIYRGEGQCSSDWAASKRLSFSRLSFSKSQICDKSILYSNLLENASVKFPSHFEHF